jgi:hypothetical protein
VTQAAAIFWSSIVLITISVMFGIVYASGTVDMRPLGRLLGRVARFVLWPVMPFLELVGLAERATDELPPAPGPSSRALLDVPPGTYPCPRCELGPALSRTHAAGEQDDELACLVCGGICLDETRARAFLLDRLGVDAAAMRELAQGFAGSAAACPRCRTRMNALTLKGTPIDACFGCGALWLDRGERDRLAAVLRTERVEAS